ncbi:hypothetical protein [Mesorhizobium xinjiangense]|uniref:hypothetical protein n=1 Tax=Mesorhizobium xinjiangense TaxID=2678685 RepID=UPI0012EDE0A7|nr:hypothetical protein [Mesorhizobium xinjiangense]
MRIVLVAATLSILSAIPLFVEELFMPEVEMLGAGIIFSIGQVVAAALCLPQILKSLLHNTGTD